MEKRPEPTYFAVIPASVRYDKNVPQGAKLLFGEISALCNKEGYCWAGNAYFAELYQTNEKTIRNWIGALRDSGHISVDFKYVPGKKEIESRLIRLTEVAIIKNNNLQPVSNEKSADEADEVGKKIATGGEKICHTYGKNLPEVGKISSRGGEKICRDNTTSNITNTTAASPPNVTPDHDPLPTVDNVVAAGVFKSKELKSKFLVIDKRLIFNSDFYLKAAHFMTEKKLDLNYVSWLRDYCEKIDYSNFKGLYYTLFFKEDIAEEYIATFQNEVSNNSPPPDISCPVCSVKHSPLDDECPVCSLPQYPNSQQIQLYSELNSLSPEKREEYFSEMSKISNECGSDFIKIKKQITKLRHDFALKLTS